ncbi:hypothetical protein GGR51DRAFT_353648 [Nemania sp. FL0031]|nr:hypothetical protein GGR51DRAFT_353648 [Nemania sp. FL0031]
MFSSGPIYSSSSIYDRTGDNLYEGYQRNTNENSIIRLRLTAEDAYGYNELQIYKQSVLPIEFSSPEGSVIGNSTTSISSSLVAASGQNNIIYFDHATMEKLELYQTRPLQQVAGIQTAAVHWNSFRNEERLKECLAVVYSQLRNINRIVIVVNHHHRRCPSGNADDCPSPLGIYDMPYDTILKYEQGLVSWCTVGQRIQQMIRDQTFWEECNSLYAVEQIPSISMNPPRIPHICLARFASTCSHEGNLRLPTQVPSLVRDLAPDQADLDGLWNPEQPNAPVFVDYSLRNLLY